MVLGNISVRLVWQPIFLSKSFRILRNAQPTTKINWSWRRTDPIIPRQPWIWGHFWVLNNIYWKSTTNWRLMGTLFRTSWKWVSLKVDRLFIEVNFKVKCGQMVNHVDVLLFDCIFLCRVSVIQTYCLSRPDINSILTAISCRFLIYIEIV